MSFNLIISITSKLREQLWAKNLHQHMSTFLWLSGRHLYWCPVEKSLCIISDTWTIFGVFDIIHKRNSGNSSKCLTHTIPQFMEFIHQDMVDMKEIDFLDTTLFFNTMQAAHKTLQKKVYFKPTDTHAFLLKSSYHQKHTFKAIVKLHNSVPLPLLQFDRLPSSHQYTLPRALPQG